MSAKIIPVTSVPTFIPREPRKKVLLSANVLYERLVIRAHLREISSESALLRAAVIPPPGSRVHLERFPIVVSGQVVSTSASSFELSFGEAIDEDELLIAIGETPQALPTRPLFPISDHVGHLSAPGSSCGMVIPFVRH